jgi:predicted nucleic acid-binding protein
MIANPVFLDANAILYALDETSDFYNQTVTIIQRLLKDDSKLCTSHHVIEEVVYVAAKATSGKTKPVVVINEIAKIPGLVLVEPAANLEFAKRYAKLSEDYKLGVNDALLLQLMLDSGLTRLLSYDKQFAAKAVKLGIASVA